jgi:dolichol-phosphate mannosyltransferase
VIANLKSEFLRYMRFCVVGATGVVLDTALLYVLAAPAFFSINLMLGKFIAAEIALLNNFIWNNLWTFEGRSPAASRVKAFCKFNLVCAAGMLISMITLHVLARYFQMHLIVANFISIVFASLWNYILNVRFTWRSTVIRTKSEMTPP